MIIFLSFQVISILTMINPSLVKTFFTVERHLQLHKIFVWNLWHEAFLFEQLAKYMHNNFIKSDAEV